MLIIMIVSGDWTHCNGELLYGQLFSVQLFQRFPTFPQANFSNSPLTAFGVLQAYCTNIQCLLL